MTFKLRPQPASDQVVALHADSFERALAASRAAARAAPFLDGCVVLSDRAAARAASHGADILDDRPALVLRASGLESAAPTRSWPSALAAARSAGLEGEESRTPAIVETWQAIADLELGTPAEQVRLRVGLPPGNLERVRSLVEELVPDVSSWVAAGDSGLLFLETAPVDAETVRMLRNRLGPAPGPLDRRVCTAGTQANLRTSGGPPGPGVRLMHRVKEQFDPSGILNPGRYVDGI